MIKIKTIQNKGRVSKFIASIPEEHKRKDSRKIIKLMKSATQDEPMLWGDRMIGFGSHRYTYANGKPGEICDVGFAPRSRSFAVYMSNFPGHADRHFVCILQRPWAAANSCRSQRRQRNVVLFTMDGSS